MTKTYQIPNTKQNIIVIKATNYLQSSPYAPFPHRETASNALQIENDKKANYSGKKASNHQTPYDRFNNTVHRVLCGAAYRKNKQVLNSNPLIPSPFRPQTLSVPHVPVRPGHRRFAQKTPDQPIFTYSSGIRNSILQSYS